MTIHGHIQDGIIIPDGQIALPNGTEVTIVLGGSQDEMTPEQLKRQREAFARIDAIENENPGDNFSGADHDRVLYGEGT